MGIGIRRAALGEQVLAKCRICRGVERHVPAAHPGPLGAVSVRRKNGRKCVTKLSPNVNVMTLNRVKRFEKRRGFESRPSRQFWNPHSPKEMRVFSWRRAVEFTATLTARFWSCDVAFCCATGPAEAIAVAGREDVPASLPRVCPASRELTSPPRRRAQDRFGGRRGCLSLGSRSQSLRKRAECFLARAQLEVTRWGRGSRSERLEMFCPCAWPDRVWFPRDDRSIRVAPRVGA